MLLYPILALFLAVSAMPLCIRLARRYGLFDAPDALRKMHADAVPFTGGYAIIIAFALTFVGIGLFEGGSFFTQQYASFAPMYMYIAEATLIIVLLGIVDDLRELTYSQKFFFQFIAAFLMILGAIKSSIFPSVFSPETSGVLVNSIGMVVSLLWLVGTTNAINMIDGMDGLAGTTSLISAAALAAVSFLWGNPVLGIMLLTLAGAITGFLLFNLPPARVFMGDGGSMFIGFVLAFSGWLLVDSGPKDFIAILVPIVILGLPVTDTLLAFFRRIVRGSNPFVPDLDHIHHMLARRTGLSLRGSVALLALIALAYGAAGIGIAVLPVFWAWMLIGAVVAGKLVLLHYLGYTEMVWGKGARTRTSTPVRHSSSAEGGQNEGGSTGAEIVALAKVNGNGKNGTNGYHANGNGKLNGNGYHPEKAPDVKRKPDANAA